VAVGSRKSEGRGKFRMVAGVMEAGMMQHWFRLVGGRVIAVMYQSSRLLSPLQTVLIFSNTCNCKSNVSCKLNGGWTLWGLCRSSSSRRSINESVLIKESRNLDGAVGTVQLVTWDNVCADVGMVFGGDAVAGRYRLEGLQGAGHAILLASELVTTKFDGQRRLICSTLAAILSSWDR